MFPLWCQLELLWVGTHRNPLYAIPCWMSGCAPRAHALSTAPPASPVLPQISPTACSSWFSITACNCKLFWEMIFFFFFFPTDRLNIQAKDTEHVVRSLRLAQRCPNNVRRACMLQICMLKHQVSLPCWAACCYRCWIEFRVWKAASGISSQYFGSFVVRLRAVI